ncbi:MULTISPECIES: hypothetical protein [Xanthomonas]|uniref:hypothetical protein n=1 Tax=Xanthomonas TaxID=338 RepID=UPI0003B0FDC2|nr:MULTISPECIES: hypothetical protein [Xanthomonas]ATB60806.1 hypothetical protein CKU38_04502 [Xanthomonas citri pv. fuscans]ATS66029.1 hypothetical protein XcfCFBP4885P_22405 [Xanthomonas citri pv. phaseoli var. fuscans]ATS70153.1 hypothetical protein XcfCFBP6165P_22490 [Xanthomonas citri pv. phaseoli var. fuscans]ATS74207.1 hypothetical protein XcfCFBP6166P_22365 [Xanthomonas citri pv. phaseoli var. fuscans]ATS78506.1 hypothetical protein XcfCFBP6975P_23115 [Xanthomonas citri pv. phaseoli v
MNTGLTGKLAALDKNKTQPEKPTRPAADADSAQSTSRPSSAGKSAPKVGATRTVTIRHLTDDDLRRLSEFRYTHNLTIQDISIKGISMFLTSMGLAPLSAMADTPDDGQAE